MVRKLNNYKPTKFMAKDSTYSQELADYAVSFIECLCHTKGTWAGKPFELIDWQEQIIRDVFGTIKSNGYRQFNTAYIEIPKKTGKSELAAAVALLLTCGDGEERAEVYGCAADRQQASIDLSSTTDITAFVLVFPPRDEDDKFAILPYFWIPEDTLELRVRRDHVPYDVWEKQGYLMTTEGNVVNYGFIDMSPPTKELMKLTLEKKLAHGGHPVLRCWITFSSEQIQREILRQIRKNLQRKLTVLLQPSWDWIGQYDVEMMLQHLFMMNEVFCLYEYFFRSCT